MNHITNRPLRLIALYLLVGVFLDFGFQVWISSHSGFEKRANIHLVKISQCHAPSIDLFNLEPSVGEDEASLKHPSCLDASEMSQLLFVKALLHRTTIVLVKSTNLPYTAKVDLIIQQHRLLI